MAPGFTVMDEAASRRSSFQTIILHPRPDDCAEFDKLLVGALPLAGSGILLDQLLRLGDRETQDAPAGDVVPVPGDVLALPVGVDARGESIHLPKAVVAGTPCAVEAAAIELARRAYPPQTFWSRCDRVDS